MRFFIFLLLLVFTVSFSSVKAQSARQLYKRGNEKSRKGDFKAAAEDYTQALKKDPDLTDAYNARGAAYFALKEYRKALKDYTEALLRNPQDADAIYNHGVSWAALQRPDAAIKDMDHLIQLQPGNAAAWLMKAQMHYSLGNKDSACINFRKAASLNDPEAKKFVALLCEPKKAVTEDYVLPWDTSKGWRGYTRLNDEKQTYREILKKGETIDRFSIASTMIVFKQAAGLSPKTFLDGIRKENSRICPNARIQVIEEDSVAEAPYMLLSVECPLSSNTGKPQSQLIKLIRGKLNFYFVAILSSAPFLDDAFLNEWMLFLQEGKLTE